MISPSFQFLSRLCLHFLWRLYPEVKIENLWLNICLAISEWQQFFFVFFNQKSRKNCLDMILRFCHFSQSVADGHAQVFKRRDTFGLWVFYYFVLWYSQQQKCDSISAEYRTIISTVLSEITLNGAAFELTRRGKCWGSFLTWANMDVLSLGNIWMLVEFHWNIGWESCKR